MPGHESDGQCEHSTIVWIEGQGRISACHNRVVRVLALARFVLATDWG